MVSRDGIGRQVSLVTLWVLVSTVTVATVLHRRGLAKGARERKSTEDTPADKGDTNASKEFPGCTEAMEEAESVLALWFDGSTTDNHRTKWFAQVGFLQPHTFDHDRSHQQELWSFAQLMLHASSRSWACRHSWCMGFPGIVVVFGSYSAASRAASCLSPTATFRHKICNKELCCCELWKWANCFPVEMTMAMVTEMRPGFPGEVLRSLEISTPDWFSMRLVLVAESFVLAAPTLLLRAEGC